MEEDNYLLFTFPPKNTSLLNINTLKTGDILFFHASHWPATIVQYACNSVWCHIAMVIKVSNVELGIAPAWPTRSMVLNNTPRLYMFEASTFLTKVPCVMKNNCHGGVRLVALEPRLENTIDQPIGLLRLKFKNPSIQQPIFQQDIVNFIKRELGKPYEENLNNLGWAWWHSVAWINVCVKDNVEDTSSYFCSELIAEALIQSGVFKKRIIVDNYGNTMIMNIPSSNFTITDFSNSQLNSNYVDQKNFSYSLKMEYVMVLKKDNKHQY